MVFYLMYITFTVSIAIFIIYTECTKLNLEKNNFSCKKNIKIILNTCEIMTNIYNMYT